jgi:transcription antitermination factor NusG
VIVRAASNSRRGAPLEQGMTKVAKNDNSARWYIVGCRPQTERQAAEEIVALGQTVYLPSMRKEFHHRRQRKWIKRHYPLLPGYLFVLASDHWSRVLDCEHVSRVLRGQKLGEVSAPIAISDAEVQRIRADQDAGVFDDLRVDRHSIRPGELVKVNEGLMQGQSGTVETISDENIVMLIKAMCREVRATVPIEKLSRVG